MDSQGQKPQEEEIVFPTLRRESGWRLPVRSNSIPLDERPTTVLGDVGHRQQPKFPRGAVAEVAADDVASQDTALLYELVFPGAVSLDAGSKQYTAISSTLGTVARRKLAQNTIVAVLSRFVSYGVSVPLSIFTAHVLGPHDRGIYAVFVLIVVLFTYVDFGVSSAGIYLVGRKRYTLRQVVGSLLSLAIILSVIFGIIYFALALIFQVPVLSDMPVPLRVLIVFFGPVTLIGLLFERSLLAAHDVVAYNIAAIAQIAVQAVSFLLILLFFGHGLEAAAIAYGIGGITSLVLTLILLAKHTPLIPWWNSRILREMFSFGLKSYLTSLIDLGNQRLDTILLTIFTPLTMVGQYAVATSLTEITWQLPLVMSSVLFPTAASTSNTSGAKIIARTCRRMLLLLVVILLGLLITAPILIKYLYGVSFEPAVTPLIILLPGAIGFTLNKTLYNYLMGIGRHGIGIFSTGVALVTTVVLDFLLIPRIGMTGAAITSSVAYCLNGLIIFITFVAVTKTNPLQVLIATPGDFMDIGTGLLKELRGLQARVNKWTAPLAGPRKPSSDIRPIELAGFGIITGLWLSTLLVGINLSVALLGIVAILVLLTFSQRLWLLVAILVADVSLTNYSLPVAGNPSLRTVLGIALIFVFLLSLAQGYAKIGRETRIMGALIVGFLGIATVSNLINGGSTSQFISHTLAGVAVMLFLATIIQSTRDLLLVVIPLAFIQVLSSLTAFAQVYLHLSIFSADPANLQKYFGRAFGISQTPISLANGLVFYLAPIVATLLYVRFPWRARILGWIAVAIITVGIYVSGSRAGLLALGAMVVILAFWQRRTIQLVLLAVVLVGGSYYVYRTTQHSANNTSAPAVTFRSSSDTEISSAQRLVLWDAGALIARDHPLLGIGYDRYMDVSPGYEGQILPQLREQPSAMSALGHLPPHNDFLNMLDSFGILGLLLFVAIHAFAAWCAWTAWRQGNNRWLRALALGLLAALGAYFVYEFVEPGYDNALLFWTAIGAALAVKRLQTMEPQDELARINPVRHAHPRHDTSAYSEPQAQNYQDGTADHRQTSAGWPRNVQPPRVEHAGQWRERGTEQQQGWNP